MVCRQVQLIWDELASLCFDPDEIERRLRRSEEKGLYVCHETRKADCQLAGRMATSSENARLKRPRKSAQGRGPGETRLKGACPRGDRGGESPGQTRLISACPGLGSSGGRPTGAAGLTRLAADAPDRRISLSLTRLGGVWLSPGWGRFGRGGAGVGRRWLGRWWDRGGGLGGRR